jgi:hypothetical protein
MSDNQNPVAWHVTGDGYEYSTLLEEHARAIVEEEGGTVVPLYRSPSLTDAERDDMACAASRLESDPNGPRDLQVAATLRGLLERLGVLPDREHPPRKEGATPARSGESGDDSPDRE